MKVDVRCLHFENLAPPPHTQQRAATTKIRNKGVENGSSISSTTTTPPSNGRASQPLHKSQSRSQLRSPQAREGVPTTLPWQCKQTKPNKTPHHNFHCFSCTLVYVSLISEVIVDGHWRMASKFAPFCLIEFFIFIFGRQTLWSWFPGSKRYRKIYQPWKGSAKSFWQPSRFSWLKLLYRIGMLQAVIDKLARKMLEQHKFYLQFFVIMMLACLDLDFRF